MNKHISYRSSELLNTLIRNEKQFFTLNEAFSILKKNNPDAVRKLLSDMVKRGLLLRLKNGLYNIIPYERNAKDFLPDWHMAAEAIVSPSNYYIGFYSALDIHGLITQPALLEQVVTEKQIIPKFRILKGVKFEFITIGRRFFGYNKTWIDDYNKVYCSDVEKTILDCLYMPGSANGITEVIKAIARASGQIDRKKILSYLKKFNSQVVYKRLGYILSNLNILEDLREDINVHISKSYALLDPSLPIAGKHNAQWRIIDNIEIENSIKSLIT